MFKPGKGAAIYKAQELWQKYGDGPGHYRRRCAYPPCSSIYFAFRKPRSEGFCTQACYRAFLRIRSCAECSGRFEARSRNHRYCAVKCRRRAYNRRLRTAA